ncbi:GIY-YIG nuclease family protein [Clostridium akagii]|uniref:GIY-YIG nuclease family protein n=1 Tax=Clostridium akagii TaxID=91623 RepID=UPI00047B33C6|nr:GIY-YIG nuclease family protein [Clostridium akagii]
MNYVYILRCNDETLYTGYTNNLKNRIKVHNNGKGAKYTRCRLPVRVVYYEEYETKSEAMKREYAIKRFRRIDKIKLFEGFKVEEMLLK